MPQTNRATTFQFSHQTELEAIFAVFFFYAAFVCSPFLYVTVCEYLAPSYLSRACMKFVIFYFIFYFFTFLA